MTIIFCWTYPRTRSTALERAMSTVCTTMHEPFSVSYYLHTARHNDVHGATTHANNFHDVVAKIRDKETQNGLLFIKEMAYSVLRQKEAFARHAHFFLSCKHVYLIRDVRETIPSLAHQLKKVYGSDHCDDPRIEEEVGVHDLLEMVNFIEMATGVSLYRVLSQDLVEDARTAVENLCGHLSVPFCEEMLKWEVGSCLPDWEVWQKNGWHDSVMASNGFGCGTNEYEDGKQWERLVSKYGHAYEMLRTRGSNAG